VKTWFHNFAFKWVNLYRYDSVTRLEDSGGRVLEYSYPAIIQAGAAHVEFS
jgi:hypothetical protein